MSVQTLSVYYFSGGFILYISLHIIYIVIHNLYNIDHYTFYIEPTSLREPFSSVHLTDLATENSDESQNAR